MIRTVAVTPVRYKAASRQLKRKLAVYGRESSAPILSLDNAILGYPDDAKRSLGPLDLSIAHPSSGGHVLLGKNGSGKSLIAYTLASLVDEQVSPYLKAGTYSTEDSWHKRAVAKVSFQSHEELLARGGTVSKTISDGGNLSKAAKFLIVRFGLYHHLYRQVNT
jgi:molybdate transport system ATP-binding protein